MNAMQRMAWSWYKQGVAVLPVKPRRKKPPCVKWESLQTSRPPWPVVAAWWSGRFANRNLAVMCGAISGNLVVLDFDDMDIYGAWRDTHRYNLARSLTIATPRPGRHVYITVDDLPDKSFDMQGTNVKASGYCLCPPSRTFTGAYQVAQDAQILRVSSLDLAMVGLEPLVDSESSEYGVGEPLGAGLTVHVHGAGATVNVGHPTPHIRKFGACQDLQAVHLPTDIVEQVKSAVTILEVAGWYTDMQSSDGNRGNWYAGRCPHPGHDDANPSFTLSLRNGRCNCKVAGCRLHTRLGSDIIDLVGALERLDFRQTLAALALQTGLVVLGQ